MTADQYSDDYQRRFWQALFTFASVFNTIRELTDDEDSVCRGQDDGIDYAAFVKHEIFLLMSVLVFSSKQLKLSRRIVALTCAACKSRDTCVLLHNAGRPWSNL
jgi:hypothetical protein